MTASKVNTAVFVCGYILREIFLHFLRLAEFISGACQKLHIHIQRIPMENIPNDAEIFKQWLSDQFARKEKWVLNKLKFNWS